MSITQTHVPARNGLSFSAWAGQLVLAVAFGYLGVINLTLPHDVLVEKLGWMQAIPPALVRQVGVLEILGAIGVVAPWALKIVPRITSIAALGLLIVALLTIELHLGQGQWGWMPADFTLMSLALFVAWARGSHAPTGYVRGL